MDAERWWITLGYPDFEAGEDGFPRPGQVTKYYRYLKKRDDGQSWTQRDLAYVLGISENEVRNMENRNRGFSLERRRFLAQLLNVPPILYGVVTLHQIEQMLAGQQSALPARTIATTRRVLVDLEQCRQTLIGYWKSNHAHSAQQALADMRSWIALLDDELAFVNDSRQKAERYELLSGYYQLIANIQLDLQNFDDALAHLNLATQFAEQLEDFEPRVIALSIQGSVLSQQWEIVNDTYTLQATIDTLQTALAFEKKISSPVLASLLLRAGLAQARNTKSERERTEALRMIERAGNMIRGSSSDHFLKTNLSRYHLDKGAALIALGRPKDAIAELSLATDDPAFTRRSAYRDILLAQAYANKGDYAYAAELAAPALQIVKEINSQVNITRVAALYAQLKTSPFKNNPEVERLAWLLYAR